MGQSDGFHVGVISKLQLRREAWDGGYVYRMATEDSRVLLFLFIPYVKLNGNTNTSRVYVCTMITRGQTSRLCQRLYRGRQATEMEAVTTVTCPILSTVFSTFRHGHLFCRAVHLVCWTSVQHACVSASSLSLCVGHVFACTGLFMWTFQKSVTEMY